MASVNWEKCKSRGECKAIFRHCSSDSRLKNNHTNLHIDKTKTGYNKFLNTNYSEKTYEDRCKLYDKIIHNLDNTTNKNKRKDRVTMLSLTIPYPEGVGIDNIEDVDFHNKLALNMINSVCKVLDMKNFVGADIHYDEVHEYINSETKEKTMSRPHIHMFYIPVDEKGNLNARKVCSKKNMIKINKEIDKNLEAEFGFKFMTGTKKKSTKSVEQLKNESQMLKVKEELKKEAEREAQKVVRYQLDLLEKEKIEFEEEKAREKERLEKEKTEIYEYKKDLILNLGSIIKLRRNLEVYERHCAGIAKGYGLTTEKYEDLLRQKNEIPIRYRHKMDEYRAECDKKINEFKKSNIENLKKEAAVRKSASNHSEKMKKSIKDVDNHVNNVVHNIPEIIPEIKKDDYGPEF